MELSGFDSCDGVGLCCFVLVPISLTAPSYEPAVAPQRRAGDFGGGHGQNEPACGKPVETSHGQAPGRWLLHGPWMDYNRSPRPSAFARERRRTSRAPSIVKMPSPAPWHPLPWKGRSEVPRRFHSRWCVPHDDSHPMGEGRGEGASVLIPVTPQ
jgi:hypothetical protein